MHDQIKAHLHDQPFRPFRVVLTSGREYDVLSPDGMMLLLSTAVISPDPSSEVVAIINLADIVAIQPLP